MADATGAVAVLCLAFPEHPPGKPGKTRQPELDAVAVPTLVVQGASDPFGRPVGSPAHKVVLVPGNHGLTSDLEAVAAALRDWLAVLGGHREGAVLERSLAQPAAQAQHRPRVEL